MDESTDRREEIRALIDEIGAKTNARLDAVIAVILAMKAQPAFDHPKFVTTLGAITVALEPLTTRTPENQAVYERTLVLLGLLPGEPVPPP